MVMKWGFGDGGEIMVMVVRLLWCWWGFDDWGKIMVMKWGFGDGDAEVVMVINE